MKLSLALFLPLALLTGGCPLFLPEDPDPFEPDDCSSPRALDGLDGIEIGALEYVSGQNVFVPWDDDASVAITVGPQGGYMLGVALRLHGSNLPACVDHRMAVLHGEEQEALATTEYPVRTYSQPDGTRTTGTIWLIFYDRWPRQGDVIELRLQMGSFAEQRRLQIEGPRPASMRVLGPLPLRAGSTYGLELEFDRGLLEPTLVTIASSDPEVVRPVEPSLELGHEYAYGVFLTQIEAMAPGSAILSVSAHGHTIETELRVE